MKLTLYFLRQLELSRKRRALAKRMEFAAMLDDQINSGRHALYRVNQEIDQLRAEIVGLENPVDLIRRAGVA